MTSPAGADGTTDGVSVLSRALDQAGDVLGHVRPDNTSGPTPCSDWDVGTLADHLVEAPAKFAVMMRGEQPDWASPAPHVEEGWSGAFRAHGDDLMHAWHSLDGDPPVPSPWQVAELAVHTWDLARAVGYPIDRLDPEVAEVAHGFMSANLTPEQRGDVFAPAAEAPAGAGPYDVLAAFAGRSV
ncbi:TIGR03086 family metal-binding protein [Nocardioides sp. MH1]|uniref:TIGR03086 family metal-binding protein n=1 Tax=Nocardioides sp. MH1 TaxID=3242490 RepID=UPI0035230701